jgi:hypothetical protein
MRFRHPLRNEFDRIFRDIDGNSHARSLKGVVARSLTKILRPFVEQVEFAQDVSTPHDQFRYAATLAVCNQLTATLRLTVPLGEQKSALKGLLTVIDAQVGARLDQGGPIFFADFDQKLDHLSKKAPPVAPIVEKKPMEAGA